MALTSTASGAGTDQRELVSAQGDDKFMTSGRWSSKNCEDGSGPPGKAATAADQSTAARECNQNTLACYGACFATALLNRAAGSGTENQ